MSTVNQRLFGLLTTYYAHTREFRSALEQADQHTMLAVLESLSSRNADGCRNREINSINSAMMRRAMKS